MDQNGQPAAQPAPWKQAQAEVESTEGAEQSGAAFNKTGRNTDTGNFGTLGVNASQNQWLAQGTSQESASRGGWFCGILFAIEAVVLASVLIHYGKYIPLLLRFPLRLMEVGYFKDYITNISLILVAFGTVNASISSLLGADFSKNHPQLSSLFKYSGICLSLIGAVIAVVLAFVLLP